MMIITILIIIPSSLAFLEINEIMYNPNGDDNNNEFIEIYTDLNLENFTLQDWMQEDTLKLLKLTDSEYSLIVEEGFDYSNINATIYTTGATIGNNLNNDEDILVIKKQGEILDTIHYYSSWGANGNGNSLCSIDNYWKECYPTPGQDNKLSQTDYKIEINEFLPNPIGEDNANMPEGEWVELINLGDEVDLENFYFKDSANHKLFLTQTNTETTKIKDYLTVYTNGFSGFLNNEGTEKIQLYDSQSNLIDEVSYSSCKEGISWSRIENKWIQTLPTPNQPNIENENKDFKSEIQINKVYLGTDNTAKFGDNIRVRLNIYKGDTGKSSISAWIEKDDIKISKTTKFNIEEKFQKIDLTIPIQIFPNCDGKFEEGEYYLIIEGLDSQDKEKIILNGLTKNLCGEIKCSSEQVSLETCSESNINIPNSTISEVIYESTNTKSNRLAVYLFCFVLVLIIIQIVIEKWKK